LGNQGNGRTSTATADPGAASDRHHSSSLSADEQHRRALRLFGIEVSTHKIRKFANYFEQRNISVTIGSSDTGQTQNGEFVNACAVAINHTAIGALKTFPQVFGGHGLIFGVGSEQQMLGFPDLGINVLLEQCVDTEIRAAVEKTAPLICHRLTLNDRIPLVTRVTLDTGTVSLIGLTVNVGCGGMAVRLRRTIELPQRVRLTWSLHDRDSISLDATPRWNSGRLIGLQYLSAPSNLLKKWIRTYSTRLGVTAVTSPR
jgi:PilZ domain-containing protein